MSSELCASPATRTTARTTPPLCQTPAGRAS
jgi:hypothetical protein